MISFNLPDPTEQERIRRQPHRYQAEGGVHGRYVRDPYTYQEYPKIMDKTPYPQLKDFKVVGRSQAEAEVLLEHARKEWDTRQIASIVKNEKEEKIWLGDHANDIVLTPGAYPKTMDHTPAPRAAECSGVEDYREKRQIWRDKISASIVNDPVEEQLWLEEHAAEKGPKRRTELVAATDADLKAKPKRRGRKPKAVAA